MSNCIQMLVDVRKIYDLGVNKETAERKAETPIRGKLQILLEKSLHLGREVCVAKVISTTGGSDVMCAPLYDAQVIYLLDGKMRIRGFEMIQKSKRPVQFQTFYQTWEIELR